MTLGTPVAITTVDPRHGGLVTLAGVVLEQLPGGRVSLAIEHHSLRCSRDGSAITVLEGLPMVGEPRGHRNLAPAFEWAAHPLHGGPRG